MIRSMTGFTEVTFYLRIDRALLLFCVQGIMQRMPFCEIGIGARVKRRVSAYETRIG